MDYTSQQLEILNPLHDFTKSRYDINPKNYDNWQKYGEIFLTQDLVSVYVCSLCDAGKNTTTIMGVNKNFVTGEARNFWTHIQQCHSDVSNLLIAEYRKNQKKLKVQHVIVIDDDDEVEQNAVLNDEAAQKKSENSGSTLASLLNATPKKLNESESPKIVENISNPYQQEEESLCNKFRSIENELREMHGEPMEAESQSETIVLDEPRQVSNEPNEEDKQLDGNYNINQRSVLNYIVNEDSADLNKVMEREEKRLGSCEISKTPNLLSIEYANHEKALSSNYNNNSTNERHFETIDLLDCDEVQIADQVDATKDKDCTQHVNDVMDFQQQSPQHTNNPNNNLISPQLCAEQLENHQKIMEHLEHDLKQLQKRNQAHNEIIQQMPTINFNELPNQNHQYNNQSNYQHYQNSYESGPSPDLDSPFKCNFCEQRFHALWQKLRHERTHILRQNFATDKPIGDKPIADKPTTPTKQRSVLPYQCPSCKRRTGTKKSMIHHINRYHPGIQADTQPNIKNFDRTHKCKHCSLLYRSKGALKFHMKQKHADLPTASFAAPDAVASTPTAPYNCSLESNSSNDCNKTEQVEMMNYHCRWYMESSNQTAWSTESSQESIESIGTLLPAGCEFES